MSIRGWELPTKPTKFEQQRNLMIPQSFILILFVKIVVNIIWTILNWCVLYAQFLICNYFQPSDNCVSGLEQIKPTMTCTIAEGLEPVSEHVKKQ